ncbi:MAG: hypothetical protein J5577_03590 [Bacteroidales bacterium]|nr:hypothetical protein [Bacteroidales bacterium]MBR4817951.1 hypothetical protein [Bacteroidales bacterium]
MKRLMTILLLAAVAAGAVSCTVPRYISAEQVYNDEWVGQEYANIVQTFGAPDREVSDGRDGSIVVYQDAITEFIEDPYYLGPTIIRQGKDYTQFFIDENDVCYKVMTDRVIQDGRRISIIGTLSVATLVTTLLVGFLAAQ